MAGPAYLGISPRACSALRAWKATCGASSIAFSTSELSPVRAYWLSIWQISTFAGLSTRHISRSVCRHGGQTLVAAKAQPIS